MLLFRFIVFGLLGGAAVCFAFYIATGRAQYRRYGLTLLKWAVVAGLAFFGVLILGRIV